MIYLEQLITVYIWPVTWITGLFSIIIYIVLTINRYFQDRKQQHRNNRSREIEQQLLIHLSNPLRDVKAALVREADDLEIIADLAPKMLRRLKGSSYNQLLSCLRELGLYQWCIEGLRCKNLARKIIAIHMAAHWPTDQVEKELLALIKNRHKLISHAAIVTLSDLGDPEILPLIVKEMERRDDFSIHLMGDVLQRFGDEIVEKLEDLISGSVSLPLKRAALMALISQGNSNSLFRAWEALYNHTDNYLRTLSYRALLHSGKKVAPELLNAGARDDLWRVRELVTQCAVNALPASTELLFKLIDDENSFVAYQAGRGLFDFGPSGVKLLEVLSTKESRAGNRARMIVEELRSSRNGGGYGVA